MSEYKSEYEDEEPEEPSDGFSFGNSNGPDFQMVNSSNLAWVDYDTAQTRMIIGFHQESRVYEYYDVPRRVFQELLTAPSVGGYFRANLYFGHRRNLLGQWRSRGKGVTYDEIT